MDKRSSQTGDINTLLIPLILTVIFLASAIGFGIWAFSQREDYKNKSDSKVAAAVVIARRQEDILKNKAFAEAEKQPLVTFNGPAEYGGIAVSYPKTWSTYVGSTQSQAINAYFNPSAVPSVSDSESIYALRVQVVSTAYATVVKNLTAGVKTGKVTAAPFTLPKVSTVVGTRFDGLINSGKKITGSMVVLPLRDKTIEIWTENPQFVTDFNNTILPNVTFSP